MIFFLQTSLQLGCLGLNSVEFAGKNEPVALVKGLTVNGDGSNVIDVIGVIGEDPGQSWVDAEGGWLTRDKTLGRKAEIEMGTGPVVGVVQDTFAYDQYNVWGKNNFYGIGSHDCTCDPDFMVATEDLNRQSLCFDMLFCILKFVPVVSLSTP